MCVSEREVESLGLQKGNLLSWGEGLQATPVSLLPTLYKQTRATGQQDSDLGALPGTTLAPVSQGTHLLSCSKQGSHTRTSFSMPNLGMVEYLEEHLPQKIWPHARQWCCDTGWSGRPGQPLFTPTFCPALPAAGSARLGLPGWGGQKVSLGGHKGPGGTGHTRKLSIIASTLRKSSQIDKKSSQKNTQAVLMSKFCCTVSLGSLLRCPRPQLQ